MDPGEYIGRSSWQVLLLQSNAFNLASLFLGSSLSDHSVAEAGFGYYLHRCQSRDDVTNCADSNTLPLLTLPYATYRARSYDPVNDIYIFANIRFAAPPLGELRWAPPAEPLTESEIQDGSIGASCYQSTNGEVHYPRVMLTKFSIAQPALDLGFPPSEDCLFLDVYVPGSAVRNAAVANMPVLFWIYGGGYSEISL